MPKKLILLNGGIGSGKTELTNYLHSLYTLKNRRCKDKLHTLTMEFFCVDPDVYWNIYETRELKEKPNSAFRIKILEINKLTKYINSKNLQEDIRFLTLKTNMNEEYVTLSIREAMIYVSEILCKPAFGQEYFGEARIKSMEEGEVGVDDSVGFALEMNPAIRELGQENLLLIRIKGRGNFNGDSRSYIEDGVVTNTVDVYNTSSLQSMFDICNAHVKNFLEET